MASTVYNEKSARVYSPTSADLNADIPYAVQVEPPVTTTTTSRYPGGCAPPSQRGPAGHWTIALFDCCAAPSHYALAFFFPCVNASYAAHQIGRSGILTALVFFLIYTAYVIFVVAAQTIDDGGLQFFSISLDVTNNDWSTAASICALLFVASVVMLRRQVRAFYRIPGSSIHDCCCSLWCSCCVVAQMSSHAERVKSKRSSTMATLPAYQEA